jgi:hypothetical protein
MFPDKPIFTYVGMVLAVAAMVMTVLLPQYADFMWTIAAILGFGSVAALRTYIDAKGWKTYGLFGVVIILSIAQWVGWMTPEVYNSLMALFLPLFGITYQQAQTKAGVLKKKAA